MPSYADGFGELCARGLKTQQANKHMTCDSGYPIVVLEQSVKENRRGLVCVTHRAVSVSLVGGDRCPKTRRTENHVGTVGIFILARNTFYLNILKVSF